MREDWIEVELKEVCFASKGKKPPVLESECSEKVNVPYINIKAFEKGIIDEYTDGKKCNLCEDGDLLMVWDGARAGFSGKAIKGAVGSTLMKIEEVKGIEKQYLSYFLLSLYIKINTNPRGVGIPHVEPRILWHSKLLIVSIPIQRAIVSKIEALFSDLDNGINNLKKAQDQLKIYRQAVLKKAFEGELTKKWRALRQAQGTQALSSVKVPELVEGTAQQQNHSPDNLPKGWKWVKLGEVATKIGSGSTPTGGQANYKTEGIPLIRSMNIHFDYIKYDGLAFIDELQAKKLNNVIVYENDILLNITGASIGRVNLAPKYFNNARVNQHVSIIRINKNEFVPQFVKYYLQSPKIQDWINSENYGATRQALSKTMIENIEVPKIKIQEQIQIVQEIESRLSVCDKMEQSIKESLEKAESLRQSILKKAFEGKLLSKAEIEQCKEASDYEPASELLTRIEHSRNEKIKADASTRSARGKLAKEQALRQAQGDKKKKSTTKKKDVAKSKIPTDMQAGVISKVIQLHENNPEYLKHLTHVKCEKISHLVEYHLQIPLGRTPVKDAAGPDDYNHLKKVEHRAKMAEYFTVEKQKIGYTYLSNRNITVAIDKLESKLTTIQKEQLDRLIDLFLKFDLESVEIIATLYAGWNNLLIDGKSPTDDEIVFESRENWSQRKLAIRKGRFYRALQWMRKDENALIPTGYGNKVLKPKNKR